MTVIGRAGGADTDRQELHVIFGRREPVSEPGFLFETETVVVNTAYCLVAFKYGFVFSKMRLSG